MMLINQFFCIDLNGGAMSLLEEVIVILQLIAMMMGLMERH